MFAKRLATQLACDNSVTSVQKMISDFIGIKTNTCQGIHGVTVHAEHQSGLTTLDYSIKGKYMSVALTRSPSNRVRVLTRNPSIAARFIGRVRIPTPILGRTV